MPRNEGGESIDALLRRADMRGMPMNGRKFYIGGQEVSGLTRADTPDQKAYVIHDVTQMSLTSLRLHLCTVGPMRCAACQLCAYGREYALRMAEDAGQQKLPRKRTYEAKGRRDKALRARWRAEGLCNRCGRRPPVPGRVACQECLDFGRKYQQARREPGKFEKEEM